MGTEEMVAVVRVAVRLDVGEGEREGEWAEQGQIELTKRE